MPSFQKQHADGINSLYEGSRTLAERTHFIGMDTHTVAKGRRELAQHDLDIERIRKAGGGRKQAEKKRPKSSPKLKS